MRPCSPAAIPISYPSPPLIRIIRMLVAVLNSAFEVKFGLAEDRGKLDPEDPEKTRGRRTKAASNIAEQCEKRLPKEVTMRKRVATFAQAMALILAAAGVAMATPSTQIWIPSTDVQGFGTFHLGIDNYIRLSRNSAGGRDPNVYDIGPVAGFLPLKNLQTSMATAQMSTTTTP